MITDQDLSNADAALSIVFYATLGDIPPLPRAEGYALEGVRRHIGPFKDEVATPASTLEACVADFKTWCEAVKSECPNEPPFSSAGRPVLLQRAGDSPEPAFLWRLMAVPTTPYEYGGFDACARPAAVS